jgi:methionyl-tRNA formyltransferase
MRIVIFTSEEPFYLPRFMQQVADRRASDIAALVLTPPVHGTKTWWEMARLYRTLYGWWGFVIQATRFAMRKALDKLSRVIRKQHFYSVRRVAHHYSIPVETPRDVNSPEFVDRIRELKPDLLVSVSSGQIFRKELLGTASMGCINVHSSLLPRYRGLLPTFWVLANGERETGVTVHRMDESVDTGGILLQRRVPIEAEETHHSLLEKTKRLGAEMLLEVLDGIERETLATTANDGDVASYFSFPTAEDVKRFRRAGLRFR